MGTVPNPRTWHVEETVTAALLNQEIRDALQWMLTDRPRIAVTRSVGFTNADHQVSTPVPWNQESFKVDFTHSNSVNAERLVVETGGLYLVVANISFESNNTSGQRLVHLQRNGTSTFASANMQPPGPLVDSQLSLCGYQRASPGDWFQVNVYQSSGLDNQEINAISTAGAVWMER